MIESLDRARRALSSLLASYPFFGSLALRLPLSEELGVMTIASDGEEIYYNPRWIVESDADTVRAAMARVVLACTLKHHTRRGDRNYEVWQQASREVTLPIIRDAGLVSDPGGMETTVEEAYEQLNEDRDDEDSSQADSDDQGEEGDGEGSGLKDSLNFGEVLDYGGEDQEISQEEVATQEQAWDEAAHQSMRHAMFQGLVPAKAQATPVLYRYHTTIRGGNSTVKSIPIAVAKRIAKDYGYDQVVIVARKTGSEGREHVTTYGKNKAHCQVAAQIGNFLKFEIMGWVERKAHRDRERQRYELQT